MADIYGQLVKAQLEHSTSDLSNVSGLVYYKSDTGVVKYYDAIATAWKTLVDTTTAMTNPLTTTGDIVYSSSGSTVARRAIGTEGKSLRVVSGVPNWAWEATSSAKSADYTVTDTDGITVILMTTSNTTRTVTLPTAADNTDRVLTIVKVDSGTGHVTIDGEGAETIDGATGLTLAQQYSTVTLLCNGTAWFVINHGFQAETLQSQASITGVNATTKSVTSIVLPPGTWDVSGTVVINRDTTTVMGGNQTIGLHTTVDTMGSDIALNRVDHLISDGSAPGNNARSALHMPVNRLTISATDTYFLQCLTQFSSTAPTLYGHIIARRVKF